MSHIVYISKLIQWIDEAKFAFISKNKVRKDLFCAFRECFVPCSVFESNDITFVIPSAHFVTIASFLNLDGKSDKLEKDEILSFLQTMETLSYSVRNYIRNKESNNPGFASSITKASLSRTMFEVKEPETKVSVLLTQPQQTQQQQTQQQQQQQPQQSHPGSGESSSRYQTSAVSVHSQTPNLGQSRLEPVSDVFSQL